MCTDNFLLITVHTICQTCQEQNVQEPIPNVAVHYSAKDLLSKCAPGTRCTKAQLYFRVNIYYLY